MTPADKRILELVDRWLTSLDLHLKYAKLDDAAYWQVQPWPKHDRPNRWILELARQKVLELKALCQTQASSGGDGKFAESLELMAFLANLVGAQHVQRFIPIADPDKERKESSADSTAEQPGPATLTTDAKETNDHTREMPRPPVSHKKATVTAKAPRTAIAAPQSKPEVAKSAGSAPAEVQQAIMADAVRLLKWGRQWHELAELIARMADRPNAAEVRRILRARKPDIEAQVTGDAADR